MIFVLVNETIHVSGENSVQIDRNQNSVNRRHCLIKAQSDIADDMVLLGRIELPTSSLPMTRSTTELQQHTVGG